MLCCVVYGDISDVLLDLTTVLCGVQCVLSADGLGRQALMAQAEDLAVVVLCCAVVSDWNLTTVLHAVQCAVRR